MNFSIGIRKIVGWLRSQILLNLRVIKYGAVGFIGILVNLGTMTFFVSISSQRGWLPSAVATTASTINNFVFHNLWTFSDRQHRGLRLVRGFLSFVLMSGAGICITTWAYVSFTRLAAHLKITSSHLGGIGIILTCQFVAILLGASISYALNRQFTWARTKESAPADSDDLPETDMEGSPSGIWQDAT